VVLQYKSGVFIIYILYYGIKLCSISTQYLTVHDWSLMSLDELAQCSRTLIPGAEEVIGWSCLMLYCVGTLDDDSD